jgi:hypothetical protein
MLRYGLILAALVAGLVFARPALAATPKISDEAAFFSKDAVDKATQKLNDLKSRFKVEVVIETFADIPEEKKAGYKPEQKAAFFKRWAESRAVDQGVKGIYMLVCKDPAYLYMEPDQAVRRKTFTLDDRTALVKKVRQDFGDKKFDDALSEVVNTVESTVAKNLAPQGGK